MQHTTNYNLPQWEATDAVKRADVNGALAAVDAALGAMLRMQWGSYVGTGTGSVTLTFDFTPKLVFLLDSPSAYDGGRYPSQIYGPIVMVWGVNRDFYNYENWKQPTSSTIYVNTATYSGSTLSWYCSPSGRPLYALNASGYTYHYLAIG